jgi:hypothetical protein
MATVYSPPEGFDPPVLSIEDFRSGAYDAKEQAYIDALAARCRENGTSDLLGKTVQWQRGDGYAQYMVWTTKPLALLHLPLGDAWQVEDALIRGLRVTDIREQVERADRLRALFSAPREV